MKLVEANALGNQLMEQHGLKQQGWRLGFNSNKNRYGVCKFKSKLIELSQIKVPLMEDEDVKDTLLHEIAHALVGVNHHHDWTWKAMASRIGAKPNRTSNKVDRMDIPGGWIGTCPNEHRIKVFRLTRGRQKSSCSQCSPRYDSRFLLQWRRA